MSYAWAQSGEWNEIKVYDLISICLVLIHKDPLIRKLYFCKISGGEVQIVLCKPSQGRPSRFLTKRAFRHHSTLQTPTARMIWRHHKPSSATHLHTDFCASAPALLLLPLLNPGAEVRVLFTLGFQILRWIPD